MLYIVEKILHAKNRKMTSHGLSIHFPTRRKSLQLKNLLSLRFYSTAGKCLSRLFPQISAATTAAAAAASLK